MSQEEASRHYGMAPRPRAAETPAWCTNPRPWVRPWTCVSGGGSAGASVPGLRFPFNPSSTYKCLPRARHSAHHPGQWSWLRKRHKFATQGQRLRWPLRQRGRQKRFHLRGWDARFGMLHARGIAWDGSSGPAIQVLAVLGTGFPG